MTTTRSIAVTILAISLGGCCLEKVTLKPEMSAVDVKAATAGNVKGEIEVIFKDCCPSKEQRAIALEMQAGVGTLYQKLLNNEVTLEVYNAKVKAAREAIESVVLICSPTRRGELPTLTLGLEFESLDAAWKRVAEVNGILTQ